jgi:hypothetical protein
MVVLFPDIQQPQPAVTAKRQSAQKSPTLKCLLSQIVSNDLTDVYDW